MQQFKNIPICRESILTGDIRSMAMDIDPKQVQNWLDSNRATRPLIQNAFPELSADEREFILTGVTPAEWEEIFGEEE